MSLPDPRTLTVRLIDPVSCTLTAAGPLGSLGLTVAQGSASGNEYRFDLPEAGEAKGIELEHQVARGVFLIRVGEDVIAIFFVL